MIIYLAILVLLLLACKGLKPTPGAVLLFYAALFVIAAGRGESVGIDTVNYYQNGFSSAYGGENHQFEVVFVGICDLIRVLGLNPRWCIYVLSAVTMSFLYAAARRFRVNPLFALLFFVLFSYYMHSLNIARQTAACSILLYAYSFLFSDFRRGRRKPVRRPAMSATPPDPAVGIKEKKPKKRKKHRRISRNVVWFCLLVLLAASFHVGAILGLAALPISWLHFERTKMKPLTVSLVLVGLFAAVQLGRSLLLSTSMGLLSTIAIYDTLGAETASSSLSLFGFLYRMVAYFFLGTALFYLKADSHNRLFNLFLASILLRILLSAFYGNIFRLNLYFSIIDVIVFSLCAARKGKGRQKFYLLSVLYYSIDYVLILTGNTYGTVPYTFEWIRIL